MRSSYIPQLPSESLPYDLVLNLGQWRSAAQLQQFRWTSRQAVTSAVPSRPPSAMTRAGTPRIQQPLTIPITPQQVQHMTPQLDEHHGHPALPSLQAHMLAAYGTVPVPSVSSSAPSASATASVLSSVPSASVPSSVPPVPSLVPSTMSSVPHDLHTRKRTREMPGEEDIESGRVDKRLRVDTRRPEVGDQYPSPAGTTPYPITGMPPSTVRQSWGPLHTVPSTHYALPTAYAPHPPPPPQYLAAARWDTRLPFNHPVS